ncbi:MAG: dihydrodipicolinate synthase family protein [Planctomycetota bacterium]|jgi:N-acetylneuraminate lyase
MEQFEGLVAAPPTPMHADASIDLDTIAPLCRMLKANGVGGAFVCGTTGECLSLTVRERQQVVERWVATADADFAVVVNVGHNCLAACQELAAHAQRTGADAIALMAPNYFKPASVEGLVLFCAQVAGAAPDLPFYYYHIPGMTGVTIPVADFMIAAAGSISSLSGAKFTSDDLADFGRCLELDGGRFNMLFGRDENLLAALALGARGAVGTTYNFASPLFLRILDACAAGDMAAARREQSRAREVLAVYYKAGGVVAAKAIMRMIGLDCGPPRLPLRELDEAACETLCAELTAIGFFDYCCRPVSPQ